MACSRYYNENYRQKKNEIPTIFGVRLPDHLEMVSAKMWYTFIVTRFFVLRGGVRTPWCGRLSPARSPPPLPSPTPSPSRHPTPLPSPPAVAAVGWLVLRYIAGASVHQHLSSGFYRWKPCDSGGDGTEQNPKRRSGRWQWD